MQRQGRQQSSRVYEDQTTASTNTRASGGTDDPQHVPQVQLSVLERSVYWSTYIGLILYATYRVYLAGNEYEEHLPAYSFSPGWSFIGRQQDVSNFEWTFWGSWFLKIWPWLLGHVVMSTTVGMVAPKLRRYTYPVLGITALVYLMGWKAVFIQIAHCVIAYAAAKLTRSVACVWVTCLLLLSTLNFDPFSRFMENLIDDDPYESKYNLLIFTTAMTNLRYISFCLELCYESSLQDSGLVDMVIYCFYLPVFFSGPLMTYSTFQAQINSLAKPWTKHRARTYVTAAARLLLWWTIYELTSHFLYTDAMMTPRVLRRCSKWVMTGMAYLSGQLFMVKYVLMFGLPSLVAQFDDLDPPKGPMCISRIYLYSQMWKGFDRGLYSFLKRYIYIPLGGSAHGIVRQLFGSSMCFLFIFYWHGAEHYLYVWCVLNFVGITLEAAKKCVGRLPALQTYQFPFSREMERRFTALVTVPMLGLSTFGYFYFMGGSDIGEIYLRRLLVGGATTTLVAVSYYVQIQVSMDIEMWEKS